jgi:hypothetical protein
MKTVAVTDSVIADSNQDRLFSGMPSPLAGIAEMRATARWTATALGAIGVALVGGGPLAAVGKIHGIGHAVEALAGLLIAIAGLGWAIWHTTEALMPHPTTLAALDTPEFAELRAQIEADPAAFFGRFGTSAHELKAQYVLWQTAAAKTSRMLAGEHDENRKRILAQGLADAQANAARAGARLRWLIDFMAAWRVRYELRRARVHAFAGAAVTALGAIVFVAATTVI